MILNLVKKDFLLIKKYIFMMMLMIIAIPFFVMWRIPGLLGIVTFLIIVIFSEFILYQYILIEEMKYPKASALLCASPYLRRDIVIARYIFLLLIFIYCCIVYNIIAIFLLKTKYLTPVHMLAALLILVILFGIYTPIQYRFGYEKTKYFFYIIILITPFLMPTLGKMNISSAFMKAMELSAIFQSLILLILSILILIISVLLSVKIYAKKDLL